MATSVRPYYLIAPDSDKAVWDMPQQWAWRALKSEDPAHRGETYYVNTVTEERVWVGAGEPCSPRHHPPWFKSTAGQLDLREGLFYFSQGSIIRQDGDMTYQRGYSWGHSFGRMVTTHHTG
jgi:hypothetical protein